MNYFYTSCYTGRGFDYVKSNSANFDSFKYILKGHPMSVKQKIFKTICESLDKSKTDYTVYKNYNDEIQSVICLEGNFIVCDGTYPYDEKSISFGVVDSEINFDMFQESRILYKNRFEITELTKEINVQQKRCERFLFAAQGLLKERKGLEKDNIDTRKISRYSNRLWSTYGCYPCGRVGSEKKVYSSVITSTGVEFVGENLLMDCDTGILILDPIGNVSSIIIDRIRRYALGCGVDVISCKSYLNPDDIIDAVIIPSMRFGVFSNESCLKHSVPNIKRVRADRFKINKQDENTKVRLQFNQRANDALMNEVFACIEKVEKLNKKLDAYYSKVIDENALTEYVLSRVV